MELQLLSECLYLSIPAKLKICIPEIKLPPSKLLDLLHKSKTSVEMRSGVRGQGSEVKNSSNINRILRFKTKKIYSCKRSIAKTLQPEPEKYVLDVGDR